MPRWEEDIPQVRGKLPGGAPLRRTAPDGECRARIAFLGVYPAAAKLRPFPVGGKTLNLPVEVESESFSPRSASGAKFDSHYLRALGLDRKMVLVTDMLPYYLANASASGKDGRSMADNVEAFEAENGPTGIGRRLAPDALVQLASTMKGNRERLTDYLARWKPKLLFTLGAEAAAFVREEPFRDIESRVDQLFYARPEPRTFLGIDLDVVHLAHPHHFIRNTEKWITAHQDWCESHGRALVAEVARGAQSVQ